MERKYEKGTTATREYWTWVSIKQRCGNPKARNYKNYGGRGIKVCEGLSSDFGAFFRLLGKRPSPSHSLDRKDNDGHYSCGQCAECLRNRWRPNVRWASRAQQQRNTRVNHLVTVNGITRCLTDWMALSPIRNCTIQKRLRKGWPDEAALFTPVNEIKSRASISRADRLAERGA